MYNKSKMGMWLCEIKNKILNELKKKLKRKWIKKGLYNLLIDDDDDDDVVFYNNLFISLLKCMLFFCNFYW